MRAPRFTNDMVRINNTFSFAREDDISYIDALKPLPGAVTIKTEENENNNQLQNVIKISKELKE